MESQAGTVIIMSLILKLKELSLFLLKKNVEKKMTHIYFLRS